MAKVTVTESIVVRVAKVLSDELGVMVTCSTNESDSEAEDRSMFICLGVTRRVPSAIPFLKRSVTASIGTLYLKKEELGAEPRKNWLLLVKGREHMEKLTQVAEALSDRFDVHIHVRLEQEEEDLPYDNEP